MEVIVHPETEKKIASLKYNLPHAILLVGEKGVGLATFARDLADSNLSGFIAPTNTDGKNDENGTIPVSAIRELYQQTRTKHLSTTFFIIDDADRMSHGAQGAFLKLLEEPPENVHFILTSHSFQTLLPTIRSRVQVINVEAVTAKQTRSFLEQKGSFDEKKLHQLEYLAAGLPAELSRLIEDDSYFEKRAEIMIDTRTFLTGSLLEKLMIIHKYHQNKSNSLQLIDSALMATRRSVSSQPSLDHINQLSSLLSIRENLNNNYSIRLQLLSFVL